MESNAGLQLMNSEVMTWTETKSWRLNPQSLPGAPAIGIFEGCHLPKATDLNTCCIKEWFLTTNINRTNKGYDYIDPTIKLGNKGKTF